MTDELIEANLLVTVFGGSGFIGRHVVCALARRGWRIRVAVRRPDLAFHLQPLGDVGQIHAVQANLRYPDSVAHALGDAQPPSIWLAYCSSRARSVSTLFNTLARKPSPRRCRRRAWTYKSRRQSVPLNRLCAAL